MPNFDPQKISSASHSNDELVSPEEVNDFMLKIGYVKMNAVKDHREVTRFEDPSHELQNISVPLAVLLTMRFKAYASQCRKEEREIVKQEVLLYEDVMIDKSELVELQDHRLAELEKEQPNGN